VQYFKQWQLDNKIDQSRLETYRQILLPYITVRKAPIGSTVNQRSKYLVAEGSKAAVERHHDCIVINLWRLIFNANVISASLQGLLTLPQIRFQKGPRLIIIINQVSEVYNDKKYVKVGRKCQITLNLCFDCPHEEHQR
jgi:hypothetical protein